MILLELLLLQLLLLALLLARLLALALRAPLVVAALVGGGALGEVEAEHLSEGVDARGVGHLVGRGGRPCHHGSADTLLRDTEEEKVGYKRPLGC